MTSAVNAVTWNDRGERSEPADRGDDRSRREERRARRKMRRAYGAWKSRRWTPFEIALMVIGFVVFWPIGLAMLLWILWKKKEGADMTMPGWMSRISAFGRTSGNTAFEDWKGAELARLEEERKKLFLAQEEFEDFVDQLKRAKDREEFDRFMAGRGKPAAA